MVSMFRDFSWSAVAAGSLAAFVGFASSFALVIQGLITVGASPSQAASGLMAASIAMGLCGIFLSAKYRQPISVAWSTPGAAFLATMAMPQGGFNEAVGAFVITAILIILAGLWKPLGQAVEKIPKSIASGMLAGILLPLCLAPFQAIAEFPAMALPIFLSWVIVGRFNKLMAMPVAVLVAAILLALNYGDQMSGLGGAWAKAEWVTPQLSLTAVTGISIPLFIITMAGQNITGIAVLSTFGYHPNAGKMFSWTGLFSLLSAPFGCLGVNLAAITAAICAGEDAHADPAKRYLSAIVCGVLYVIFGLSAGFAVAFIQVSPPIIIAAVAGLALMGALAGALKNAMAQTGEQEAALITFLITASGITFFGIGGAFWGLLAGILVYFLRR